MLIPGTSFIGLGAEKKKLFHLLLKGECVYGKDVPRLISSIIKYKADNWSLFIDSFKISLKAALLHNGSKYASKPVGHSVYLKEC